MLCLWAGDLLGQFPRSWGWSDFPFLDEWNAGGIISQPVGSDDDTIRASTYQSDGKLVVVGRQNNGTHNDFLIIRYHPDGGLDTSFGGTGAVTVNFPDGESLAHSVVIDNQGKIVVAGRAWNPTDYDFGVARLTSNGALDPAFAAGVGYARIDFGGDEFARGIATDLANRIVIAGYSNQAGTYDVAVARLTTAGVLDATFSGDGLVTTTLGTGWDIGYAIDIDPQGKYLVAGSSRTAGGEDFAILRYQTNGVLDPAFSGDGWDVWSLSTLNDNAWALTQDTNNQILVTGFADQGASHSMALAIYATDGSRVTANSYSFAGGGVARSVHADTSGSITLGGRAWNGTDWDFAALRIQAAVGLDVGFSGDGVSLTSIGTRDDMAYGMAVQTDGKLVVVGVANNGTNDDFAVARFLTSGGLDTAFSADGKVINSMGTTSDVAMSVAIQTNNGRIVVAGYAYNGANNDFAVQRYYTNGNLDTSFSNDGKIITTLGSGHNVANAVKLDAFGRIVIAGKAYNGANDDFAIQRFTSNGVPDNAFSGDSRQITTFGTTDDQAHGLAIATNGRIMVAGETVIGGNKLFAIARFHTNGNLDTSFDTDGKVTTSFAGSSDDSAKEVLMQPNGRILVGGHSYNTAGKVFALARYATNGILDTSFSTDGLVTTAIVNDGAELTAMSLQTDGRIVAVGRTLELENRLVIVRYLSSGALDTTLDNDGIFTLQFTNGDEALYAVSALAGGSIAAAGSGFNGTNYDFLVMRYGGFGSPDVSFGTNGRIQTPIGSGDDVAFAYSPYNNHFVLSGYSDNGSDLDLALARYSNIDGSLAGSGTLDVSLNSTGSVTTAVGAADDIAYGIALDALQRPVLAGASGATRAFAVVRYTSRGNLDSTFSTDGIVTTAVGSGHAFANDVTVQANGRILAVGQSFNGNNLDFASVRYHTNGALDTSWGTTGTVVSNLSTTGDAAHAVTIDANGRLLLAGYVMVGNDAQFAVARYTTRGVLDAAFSGDGIQTTTFVATGGEFAYAVQALPDNRVIVGGSSHGVAGKRFAIARFLTNGNADTSWGGTGTVVTAINSFGADLFALVPTYDNKWVAAGRAYGRGDDIAVARYLSNGSLDTSFSGDGIATFAMNSGDFVAFDAKVATNNKVVVAGFRQNAGQNQMMVARVNENGTLDTRFNADGYATISVGSFDDFLHAVVIASDGTISAAGISDNGTDDDFALIRMWP